MKSDIEYFMTPVFLCCVVLCSRGGESYLLAPTYYHLSSWVKYIFCVVVFALFLCCVVLCLPYFVLCSRVGEGHLLTTAHLCIFDVLGVFMLDIFYVYVC